MTADEAKEALQADKQAKLEQFARQLQEMSGAGMVLVPTVTLPGGEVVSAESWIQSIGASVKFGVSIQTA